MMQVSLGEVFNTLTVFLGSSYVNNFVKFGRTYQVNVEGDPNSRAVIEDVSRLNVRNAKGDMLSLIHI